MYNFPQNVAEMKRLGNMLIPYTVPIKASNDPDLDVLKQRHLSIDGYDVIVEYSRGDYKTHYIDVVSITGKIMPFLPMIVVLKIGKSFLGADGLIYVEFVKEDKKYYNWLNFFTKDGTVVKSRDFGDEKHVSMSFNGTNFEKISKFKQV